MIEGARHHPFRSLVAAALLCAATLAPGSAEAQPAPTGAPHVEPPPNPENRDPELLADVHVGAVVPLEAADICPGDSLCVLGGGGSFGVEIERRWAMGLGISVAYDGWFVDSGGVFELGVVHIVRAAVRYVFGPEWMIHPTVHIGGGALVFGDTVLISTVGGALDLGAGVEIELTETFALSFGARAWLFTTTPFTTGRDRTLRSEGLGLNAALQLNIGILILADTGGR